MKQYVPDESVQLIVTSPPFALRRKKEYGNKSADEYIEWFKQFAPVFWDKLKPDGSLVIDLGGSWNKDKPTRSLYQFKLLIELCEQMGDKNFHLAQEFYWYNPAKMPSPAQWVTIKRIRVKDAVNVVWWLSKSETPKANNRKVLRPYSKAMERLLERQSYNSGKRPSGHDVSAEAWKKRNAGAIAPNAMDYEFDPVLEPANLSALSEATENGVNWLEIANTKSNGAYERALRALSDVDPGVSDLARAHPARFPAQLPSFFIEFLTDPDDLVVDPFAGSNVVGAAAEEAGRTWKSFELDERYLLPSVCRFEAFETDDVHWFGDIAGPTAELLKVLSSA